MTNISYLIIGLVCCGYISSCAGQMEMLMAGAAIGNMGNMGMGYMGNRGMGNMGNMMMGNAMGMGPMDQIMLRNAVKFILGPKGEVTPELIVFAQRQGGRPTSMMGYFPYVGILQEMAARQGVEKQTPGGRVTTVYGQAARNVALRKAVRWIQNQTAGSAYASVMGM